MSGNGMLESMLEPHLKAYGAGTSGVGVTFTIFGICYVLGNLLFEWVSIINSGPSILILSKFHLDNAGRHVLLPLKLRFSKKATKVEKKNLPHDLTFA